VYKRRTLQHLKPDADLRILACIHDESHVSGTLALLEASHATPQTPIGLYRLQLVEISGRSAPVFIPHNPRRNASRIAAHNAPSTDVNRIINVFFRHELRHPEGVGAALEMEGEDGVVSGRKGKIGRLQRGPTCQVRQKQY
jgi:hypothetical protein